MRDIKTLLGLLQAVLRVILWGLGTLWLGGRTLWRAVVLVVRWPQIVAQVRRCPRGHEVPMYGLFDCACGSRIEGWVFSPCPICHETAGYVGCSLCGLPVRNPFLP